MHIRVRLLASYRSNLPEGHSADGSFLLSVEPGTRVSALRLCLPIPENEACTWLLNGGHVDANRVLQPGDVVAIFPAAGGG
jgi:molybdopterin converting factor small subunit